MSSKSDSVGGHAVVGVTEGDGIIVTSAVYSNVHSDLISLTIAVFKISHVERIW